MRIHLYGTVSEINNNSIVLSLFDKSKEIIYISKPEDFTLDEQTFIYITDIYSFDPKKFSSQPVTYGFKKHIELKVFNDLWKVIKNEKIILKILKLGWKELMKAVVTNNLKLLSSINELSKSQFKDIVKQYKKKYKSYLNKINSKKNNCNFKNWEKEISNAVLESLKEAWNIKEKEIKNIIKYKNLKTDFDFNKETHTSIALKKKRGMNDVR